MSLLLLYCVNQLIPKYHLKSQKNDNIPQLLTLKHVLNNKFFYLLLVNSEEKGITICCRHFGWMNNKQEQRQKLNNRVQFIVEVFCNFQKREREWTLLCLHQSNPKVNRKFHYILFSFQKHVVTVLLCCVFLLSLILTWLTWMNPSSWWENQYLLKAKSPPEWKLISRMSVAMKQLKESNLHSGLFRALWPPFACVPWLT